MFERYTEKARRVIFFARYEASQYGSPYIETEHLLLGLMREDKALANRFLRQQGSIESIRKEIEARITIRERISTSVEVPLSAECKRILNMAGEEAERLGVKHVGTEHLLLGILREEKCFGAEILMERGLRLSTLREELARTSGEKTAAARPKETSLLAEFSRDLTQAASEGSLDPLVGREGLRQGISGPEVISANSVADGSSTYHRRYQRRLRAEFLVRPINRLISKQRLCAAGFESVRNRQ